MARSAMAPPPSSATCEHPLMCVQNCYFPHGGCLSLVHKATLVKGTGLQQLVVLTVIWIQIYCRLCGMPVCNGHVQRTAMM